MRTLVINGATGEASGALTVDPDQVMRDTWGDQDCTPGVKYPGSIIFAVGTYGDDARAIVSAEFGDEAGYGPWFYYGINAWLSEQDVEAGVYRFDGWYRLCKNGRHQFVGKIRMIDIGA